ncbi:MAG TPA: hypothetical protein VEA81_00150, partial [Burkholderiaceae bacterium]|nr:hypothetical protein [Burkholderiaceae bacterium]
MSRLGRPPAWYILQLLRKYAGKVTPLPPAPPLGGTDIQVDSTTWVEFQGAATYAAKHAVVAAALTPPVTVTVRGTGGQEYANGTMANPWATPSSGQVTLGSVTSGGITVTQAPLPAIAFLQFTGANGRALRGRISLADGVAFKWPLETFEVGQVVALDTLLVRAPGAGRPEIITAPSLSGTLQTGQTLSLLDGAWTQSPTSYARQLQRSANGSTGWADVAGATGTTYVQQAADQGHYLRLAVIATNALGPSETVYSATVGPVIGSVPLIQSAPVIVGSAQVGQAVTFDNGTWANSPTGYARQLQLADGVSGPWSDITGVTGTSYTALAADQGKYWRLRVIASNAAGASSPQYSAVVGPVAAAASAAEPANTSLPTIEALYAGADTAAIGTILRVRRGTWTKDWLDPTARYVDPYNASRGALDDGFMNFGLMRRYQWLRNGVPITGAEGLTYTRTAADVGATIAVRETVNRIEPTPGGDPQFREALTSVSATSAATPPGTSGTLPSSLVTREHLVYLGSYRPREPYFEGYPGFDYGGTAGCIDINGDSGNGSFFCQGTGGQDRHKLTAEWSLTRKQGGGSITLKNGFTTPFESLDEALLLQPPTDATANWYAAGTAQNPGNAFQVSGQIVVGNELIQAAGSWYTQNAPVVTHARRSKNLATAGVVSSLVRSANFNGRWSSGPMCHVPSAWQSALGGPVIGGWAGASQNANTCTGLPAFSFDPSLIGSGQVSANALLAYTQLVPLSAEHRNANNTDDAKGSQDPLWSSLTPGYGVYGMAIPDGTDSILYLGIHAQGVQGYADSVGHEKEAMDALYGGGTR